MNKVKKMYPSFKLYLKAEFEGPYPATDMIVWHKDKIKEGIVKWGFFIDGQTKRRYN